MKMTETLYIKPKQSQNWNQIEESQESKNPIKIAYKRKGKNKVQYKKSNPKEEEEDVETLQRKKNI